MLAAKDSRAGKETSSSDEQLTRDKASYNSIELNPKHLTKV